MFDVYRRLRQTNFPGSLYLYLRTQLNKALSLLSIQVRLVLVCMYVFKGEYHFSL